MSALQPKTRASSFIQQLAPCVTFALAQLVEAHSFLSFSPCIELCLSGRPGGRRTQRLLHLSLRPKTKKKNLCAHYDLGPCFLNPLHTCTLHHILAYWHPCYAVYFLPLCPHLKFKWLTNSYCTKPQYLLLKFLAFLSLLSTNFTPSIREKIRRIMEVGSKI